jgi:hypothetical protein
MDGHESIADKSLADESMAGHESMADEPMAGHELKKV